MIEIIVGIVVLVFVLLLLSKFLKRMFGKYFTGVELTKEEKRDLKAKEKKAYLDRANELAVKRGHTRAGEDYDF